MSEEWGVVVFQEDRASCHCAKSTKAWLKRNSILLFAHPAKSSDLSPIESVWNTMKSKVKACAHLPISLEELKAVVLDAWNDITTEKINCSCEAYRGLCQGFSGSKGGPY